MARWLLAFLVACLVAIAPPAPAQQDTDGDTIDDTQEDAIGTAHAPLLYFHPSERYFPTSVQYALDNSVLEQYRVNATPFLADSTPTAAELALLNVPRDPQVDPELIYYLNNTQGTIRDDSGILSAYQAGTQAGTYPKTVYVHVSMDGGQVIAQYWFYYAFNPGTWNNHEGDWEMVQVVVSGTEPQWVGYSQHESGERMLWADVEREGTHPKVYVALGSHSSYLRSYEGTIGIAGDAVSGAGAVWVPSDYALVNVGEVTAPSAGNEWLQFAGRWGEFSLPYEARAEAGPPGPAYRQSQEMFTTPTAWAAGLSVPQPLILFLNWFLASLFTIFLVLFLVFLVVKVVRLALLQRKTKAGRKLWPYAHLRPVDRKSVAMLIAVAGLVVGLVAFLLPWYAVSVDANAPGFLVTNGPEDLFRVDGVTGVTLNPMRPDRSTVQINVLPLPIGLMLAITTAYFFLRIAGTKTARRLGARFIVKGVVALLPFILVLLIASLVLPALSGGGSDPGSLGVSDFLGPVAASPFGGSNTVTVTGGSATIAWGLGIGAWLLVVSAVLMLVAGGLAISQNYSFLPPTGPEAVQPPEGPEGGMEPAEPVFEATPPLVPEDGAIQPLSPALEPAAAAPASSDAGWQQAPPPASETHRPDWCPVCGAPVKPQDTRCGVCDAQL